MIPVVNDIDNLDMLYQCMTQYGFCYIPIDQNKIALTNNLVNLSKDFFDLNNETKNMYLMNKDGIGYIHKNRHSVKNNITEIKEQISIRPNEISLGEKYDLILHQYYESICSIANKIFINLLKCIGFTEEIYTEFFNTLTLLHYKQDESSLGNDLGIRQHTDWGLVTILWTDNDGLQLKINDEWINVPTLKDYFVINVGDMLEILSGGKYKSTIHRVIVKDEKYSIALFFEPSLSTIIKPLELNDNYKEISFGDYLNQKINESYTETYNLE